MNVYNFITCSLRAIFDQILLGKLLNQFTSWRKTKDNFTIIANSKTRAKACLFYVKLQANDWSKKKKKVATK